MSIDMNKDRGPDNTDNGSGSESPGNGQWVEFNGAGMEPRRVDYVPGMTYGDALQAAGLTLSKGMAMTVNGNKVKARHTVQPGTIVAIGRVVNNG